MNTKNIDQSIEHSRATPAWLFVLAALMPLIVLAIVYTQSTEMQAQMFRDTYSATIKMKPGQFPLFLGIVSNFGIVLWCAAWAVTGFVSIVLLRKGLITVGLYLLAQSFISGIFLTDDLLLMHEMVYPRFGIDETVAYLVYVCLVGLWVIAFRSVISSIGAGLLIMSGAAFALSIGGDLLDHVPHSLGIIQRWMEDATKLLGISFWTAFSLHGSWVLLADK